MKLLSFLCKKTFVFGRFSMKYSSIVVAVSVVTAEGISLVRNCKCGLLSLIQFPFRYLAKQSEIGK